MTDLTDNPITTLQVHNGGIALCCNECGVVGYFAHNPTPEDVAADDSDHRRVHDRAVEQRAAEQGRHLGWPPC